MSCETYKKWKEYFILCEEYAKNDLRCFDYEKAYLKLEKIGHKKDTVYFPVEIRGGRMSFGKTQFLIIPEGAKKGTQGERWVERKALIIRPDLMFEQLSNSINKENIDENYSLHIPSDDEERIDYSHFHKIYEKLYLENPDCAKYHKAFFRLGKNNNSKDVLYFPILIRDGRLSFGQAQFLILPYGVDSFNNNLGKRWVTRKALVMDHDRLFEHLNQAVVPQEGVSL